MKIQDILRKSLNLKNYNCQNTINGLYNNVLIINNKYIIKKYNIDSIWNKENEVEIIKKMDYLKIHFVNNEYILTNKIYGCHPKFNVKNIPSVLKALDEWRERCSGMKLYNFWKFIGSLKIKDEELNKEYDEIYIEINDYIKQIASEDDLIICHNDICFDNVIFNEKEAYLIDFETAGLNYDFYELGVILYSILRQNNDQKDENFKKVIKILSQEKMININKLLLGIIMAYFVFSKLSLTNYTTNNKLMLMNRSKILLNMCKNRLSEFTIQ
ncbi:hypothetical protein CPAV1605_1110 [seawater metagenome]|uniref:Aminoglycoside phosphotransferase domain-containing protein n=1 Tax=seawater metagenome TaxID=1561972 RepID=A0A5E8CKU9_9ZZZZ